MIGGAAGNTISGNTGSGVFSHGCRHDGQCYSGNRIGTTPTGLRQRQRRSGVFVGSGAGSNIIQSNLISGNALAGVQIAGPMATGNVIRGNTIGLDGEGVTVVANAAGVEIDSGRPTRLLVGRPQRSQHHLGQLWHRSGHLTPVRPETSYWATTSART